MEKNIPKILLKKQSANLYGIARDFGTYHDIDLQLVAPLETINSCFKQLCLCRCKFAFIAQRISYLLRKMHLAWHQLKVTPMHEVY